MNTNEKDQARLLFATFIVATVVALFAVQVKIPIDPHSWVAFVINVFVASLMLSAFFALLFVMSRGYTLMYSKKRQNFVDHHLTHWLYDLSVGSYVFLMPSFVGAYFYNYLKGLSSQGNWLATMGMILMGVVFISLVSMREIKVIIRYINQRMTSRKNNQYDQL